MVIGIFGESCTGKSTIADKLSQMTDATIYTGKDYLKLAKNEAEAKAKFVELLKANKESKENLIYVISEKEHLQLLPQSALRVLVVADIDLILERFAKRLKGNLPPPIAAMLTKKHGSFDNEKHDIKIENTDGDVLENCERIMALVE